MRPRMVCCPNSLSLKNIVSLGQIGKNFILFEEIGQHFWGGFENKSEGSSTSR